MIGWLILLIIAFICGSIGAAIAGANRTGCLTSIALGFIGALLGKIISRELGISDIIYVYRIPVIWSIIGSALFVALVNLISGNPGRR